MKLFIFILLFVHIVFVNCLRDPYKTLGVEKSASIPDIKRAYKRLAREWHPDKNKEPGAEEKFIEINKAYELLMDPERRRKFDYHGVTEDTPNFRQQPDYSDFKRFDFDPFESIFNRGGFQFQFNFNQGSVYHKYTITGRAYENTIIPGSSTQPYLVMFYGDVCFPCISAEPIWQKIILELEPIGMGFAAIHVQHEADLARRIGVSSVPYIVGVMDGRTFHYKQEQLSLLRIIEFSRRLFSSKLVIPVDKTSVDNFLGGWSDNRVRVLLFTKTEPVRLRYLLVAFKFQFRAAFAYVNVENPNMNTLLQRFGVSPQMETLLIFNENSASPIATLSMTELAPQTMRDVIEANKYLILPRLSSQELFDQLCPPDGTRTRKRLCVILITHNTQNHDPHRSVMRDFIVSEDFPNDRIRFMFLYEEKQSEFVKALSSGDGAPSDPLLHVVLLWRREQDRVYYQWLNTAWEVEEKKINSSKQELENVLTKLLQTTDALPYNVKVALLMDEHAKGLFTRIVNRLVLMGDVLQENISRQQILPAVSVVLSVGFIVLVGYIMSYLVHLEEKNIQEKYRQEGKVPPGVPNKPKQEYKLNIHELRGETYNGLIRLLKPGCRSIVLLVDKESKTKLLNKFYRIVYPYRKNKTLMFAFLMVEKNLEWYRRLLLQTLGEPRELNINPKNCIGTVLSLNGHRKYFCVYHAKHSEMKHCKLRNRKHKNGGEFIGFEESGSETENSDVEAGNLVRDQEDNETYSNILFEEYLLDGLPNWLDRLFEGSTQRYYIQYWPENMK
ncbi:dnaJ homolog subfamily C member 16-like [Centruroides sculpturatus]|uniref:dnaJ homolog subfamily C member 16-like n=1 Tax=Centruroides sculpturatus TaxID=218467 RepID=UPI000C6E85F7|nr:dnaJ homolog subfamily C member 16-like [Centruroides sculpturatus]